MAKPITHVVMITDMSGSMGPLAKDVRGGFNAYVADLRRDDGKRYRLSATLFDTEFIPLCKAAKLGDVPHMDDKNYQPRGMTALLDAVGKTVTEFDDKALGPDDRVLVVVQTDGQENSSREYRREQIAALIKDREGTGKWSFVFLGAGPDTWAQAEDLGFSKDSVVAMAATADSVRGSYSGLAASTRHYSRGGSGGDVAAAAAAASGGSVVGDDQE